MIVVDASAMVEPLLRTAVGDACRKRLLGSGEDLCAPHLLDVEVAQVLRRFSLHGEIIPDRGAEALEAPLVTCDARTARTHGHRAHVQVLE